MDLKCDNIKKYVVKIKYHENGKKGTGIIFKPNNTSDIAYVLTARHTFGSPTIKKEEINRTSISIYKHYGYNFIEVVCDDLIVYDIYDLVILFLDVKQNHLENIDQISILNHDFKDCIVAGYPNISEDEIKCYKCQHDKTSDNDDKATYQILSSQPFQTFEEKEVDNIAGLSGGGVFTKGSDDKYYLVGIEIEIRLPQNFLCIDLREIAEKLNKYLPENAQIRLEGYSYSEKIGIDPKLLDFDKIKSDLNNDYIDKIKNKEPTEQLEYIRDNNSDFKKFHKKVQSAIKVISATYLYRSILFHEYADNRRATNNFKKAIEYNPSYLLYFKEAKFLRNNPTKTNHLKISNEDSLEQLEKDCKTALETETVEEDKESKLTLLHDLKSILLKKITLVSDKPKQLKIYDELIETYLSMLSISPNDENNSAYLKKADIFYKLGKLHIRKAKIFYELGQLDIRKKEYDIAKNFLQESFKLSSNKTALKASVCRNLGYISAKQSSFKEAIKYYQETLKLYKNLQKKNPAYTKKLISIRIDLATVAAKLDKEDVINVEKHYNDIFEQLKLLEKNSEIYRKLRIRTENNLKKYRKSDSRQISEQLKELSALVSSLTESLKSEEKSLESDVHVDDWTEISTQTQLDNQDKKTAKDSKPLNFIEKYFLRKVE